MIIKDIQNKLEDYIPLFEREEVTVKELSLDLITNPMKKLPSQALRLCASALNKHL